MDFTLVPAGSLTRTGVRESLVLPSPSWPSAPLPQARMCPLVVMAMLKKQPARTEVILVPLANLTLTGVSESLVVPSPSWP